MMLSDYKPQCQLCLPSLLCLMLSCTVATPALMEHCVPAVSLATVRVSSFVDQASASPYVCLLSGTTTSFLSTLVLFKTGS